MPEPALSLSAFPPDLTANYPHAELVWGMLEASLTGLALYAPLHDEQGQLVDFRIDLLNPAAQRMLRQPARPTGTYLQHYPHTLATGVFAFHRDAFESGEPARLEVNYQADGLDNYFLLSARRVGQGLLVSFTDTAEQQRSAVEQALRESQAREQAARAEAEAQRQRLHQVLMQLPAQVAVFHGADHVYEVVNPPYQQLFPTRTLLSQPFHQAMPELAGQQYYELFDQVYRTGEPFYAQEMPVQVDFTNSGRLELRYFDVSLQALRDGQGRINGIFNFSYEVTAQVRGRQQVQGLNEELAAINEELRASNEEYLQANTALQEAQHQLRQLNQQLEARVRERTQQVVAQSSRLERLLMEAPAAIAVLDGPELVVELLNPEYEALFPGRQLRGKPLLEALPELAEGPGAALLRQVYETGVTYEGREVLMHVARPGDGQLEARFFDFVYQARYNAAGRINGLVLFGFDVTVRVQSRQQAEALQAELLRVAQGQVQQRETLYQIFAQTPAAICIQRGPEHRFEYANQAYLDFFPGRPIIGQTVAEALPETVDSGVIGLLDHVYRTGETYYGSELPLLIGQLDGSLRQMYFTFTYQAYRENGEIVGISTFAYNVADQVLARQDHERQRQQLVDTFAQAPVAICVFRGPTYVLELVNPPMGAMLGRTPAALVGRPFFEALPELANQGLREVLDGVRQTGMPFVAREREIYLAYRPQEPGFYNFTYEPQRDEQGQVVAITCVATEVTEQVRARQQVQSLNEELAAINEELQAGNEELNESNTQLTRTNADLDNFIYTASHDLKQPIANIEGLLLALQHELPPAGQVGEVPAMLTMMQQAVERFGRTIGHLTDVSRLQKEYQQPATHVGLAHVVQEVQLDLAPLLTETAAQLRVDVPAHATLLFSEKNLRSVVYNLLSNALKYRHPDRVPQVQVAYRPEAAYQVLEVQDNGLGLDLAHDQDKLFAMFQRLHTHVEGSGVGLYMVKKMVENAGGRIEVQSEPDQGATFRVYFPR